MLEIVDGPDVEPVSLELARAHLNLDVDGEGSEAASPQDAWLESVGVPGVREAAEEYTQQSLAEKTYRWSLDAFPTGAIALPMPPLVSVTSLVYVDTAGDEQTIESGNYAISRTRQRGWIVPAAGYSWPATAAVADAVRITYVAGYSAATLPKGVLWALLLALTHADANRGDQDAAGLPESARHLLHPYRVELGV